MDDTYITRIAPDDPGVVAAEAAERKLFDYYGLPYTVHHVALDEPAMRVRVLDVGIGKPVLMIPGGSGHAWPFAPLLAHLTAWRLLVVNRPGGGLSDGVDYRQVDLRRLAVNALTRVLDAFGQERVPVIGNSFGGLWAFWLALEQPSRVALLVQLGCPALLLGTSAPLFMRLMSVPGLNRLVVNQLVPGSVDSALEGLRFQGSRPEAIAALPRVFAEAAYAFGQLPTYRQNWLALIAAATTLRGPQRRYRLDAKELRRVQQPTQFIWGDADPFGALAVGEQATRLVPHAVLHDIRAGHLPHIDDAAACARLMHPFLSAHAPPLHELVPSMLTAGPRREQEAPMVL